MITLKLTSNRVILFKTFVVLKGLILLMDVNCLALFSKSISLLVENSYKFLNRNLLVSSYYIFNLSSGFSRKLEKVGQEQSPRTKDKPLKQSGIVSDFNQINITQNLFLGLGSAVMDSRGEGAINSDKISSNFEILPYVQSHLYNCNIYNEVVPKVKPIGEGNGNPLQCSCLENPKDGGAWWTVIYGVAQSWTRLKRLSSSNRLNLRVIPSSVSVSN
ncbi:hypothetical protein MG293_000780 [Ovis ammon polii]|uniref:Uncharacterized protein n=1 Tax=Ovis ammon polii TaxID=230172 RepID=A0AAD4UQY0_OVIAM|nr:hypothetical protein MG293_000780 [Ovis ammon polii]